MNIELLAIAFNHLYVLFPVIIRALTSYFSPTLDQTWDQKQQTEDALTIHQKRNHTSSPRMNQRFNLIIYTPGVK